MEKNKFEFEKNIEQLVNPQDLANLLFLQQFADTIPTKIQTKMMEKPNPKNKYMAFVVEPFSSFICYEITDTKKAQSLLPDNFEIAKTKIFKDDKEEKYYFIYGCFNIHTSAFWGTRLECNVIARNKDTGLLSWVIVDYATNTMSFDKKHGVTLPNLNKWVNTTNYDGNVIVDYRTEDKVLNFNYNSKNGTGEKLDETLWLEGNLSVGYGKQYEGEHCNTFGLKFNIQEIEEAIKIDVKNFDCEINNWWNDIIDVNTCTIACFPYAQHYLSDSPGYFSNVTSKKEMLEEKANINFTTLQGFSTAKLMKFIKTSMLLQFLIIITLICLVIFT